jgi:hypothetical protein
LQVHSQINDEWLRLILAHQQQQQQQQQQCGLTA